MAVIIFKPTEKCNSNCVYCDVVAKKKPRTMSLDLLEVVVQKINEYLLENPNETVHLTWHGGEPLILGVTYLKKAVYLFDKYCNTTKDRIEHGIQSNLTLLTQEHIDILKQLNIKSFGTSYEPIPHIRGGGKNIDSKEYNRKFFQAIKLLRRNEIGWGFIYVVTRKTLEDPIKYFNFLGNLANNGSFNMNPVLFYGEDNNEYAITPKEYADFLGTVFSYWWKHKNRYKHVTPFSRFLENYTQDNICLSCNDAGDCAYNFLYIGPDGDTSQCGRASDWDIISYGNIMDRSMTEIMQDKQREQLVERNEVLFNSESECKNCVYWKICHGGCPLDTYLQDNSFDHKTHLCESMKYFLSQYFEPITGLKPKFSHE